MLVTGYDIEEWRFQIIILFVYAPFKDGKEEVKDTL